MQTMLPFDKALKIVLDSANLLNDEKVSISDSLNRVLAEDIKSDIDLPPCDRAVMDGYACRREDIDNELEIIEIIPAGKKPEKESMREDYDRCAHTKWRRLCHNDRKYRKFYRKDGSHFW